MLAGGYQAELAMSTKEGGWNGDSEQAHPSAPHDDTAAGPAEGSTSTDWEDVSELDIYEGGAQ